MADGKSQILSYNKTESRKVFLINYKKNRYWFSDSGCKIQYRMSGKTGNSSGIDLEGWLAGFDSAEQSVEDTVFTLRNLGQDEKSNVLFSSCPE